MPPVVIGAAIVGTAAVASSAIASSGAKKAAESQARAQQEAIDAQERSAREAREQEERIAAQAREQEERIAVEAKQVQAASIAKEEALRQEAVQRKEAAAANIKFPTFLELPESQKLKTTLEERMAGQGIKLPEEQKLQATLEERMAGRGLVAPVVPLDINKQTAPFSAQRRASLTQQEIPLINATASARGLGRSTVPVSQIGQRSQAAERDIEERVAQLQIENKKIEEANIERERSQITDALGRFETFTGDRREQVDDALARFEELTGREATSQERKALFERGTEFDIADTISGKAGVIGTAERQAEEAFKEDRLSSETAFKQTQLGIEQSFKEDQFAIANSIQQKGVTQAANEMLQANIIASGLAGVAKSAENAISAIDAEKKTRNAALVNIGSGKTSSGIDVAERLVPQSGKF